MTLFQEGKQLADKEGYGRDIERKVILTRILLLINRIFQENSPREIPFPASTDQLKRILDYIDDHLAEALSLSHLSGTFGTTPNSLNRLFRKGLSMTVHQYILHRRIEYARLYLMEGRPVTDTARDAGFGDLTNFIRVFKRKTGMTPGTFRKR